MTAPFPRICISSTGGGGGKTLLSLGLCRAFCDAGLAVKPFKKGPDYIDATWLARACQAPTTNLDPFFLDGRGLRSLFTQAMTGYDLGLIEGNRGLYDGLNETGSCSTAQVARAIACPILLCVNCEKSTRTVAALLKGLTTFEAGLNFAGVILNRTGSTRHEQSLRRAIESNTDLPVLGALPRLENNPLPERHMGLASNELDHAQKLAAIFHNLASYARANCDLAAILKLAREAPPLPKAPPLARPKPCDKTPVIGVAQDAAFWFYYNDNLQALRDAGAKLRQISLLEQTEANLAAWEHLDGIYLGGGFPEDFLEKISDSVFCAKIRQAAARGLPIYAECGGLIVLGKSLEVAGAAWPLAGVFPTEAVFYPRPQGLGYVEAIITADNPWFATGEILRGHEFHYSRVTRGLDSAAYAMTLKRGKGIVRINDQNLDGLFYNNVWASYTHLFAPSAPGWAQRFVRLAQKA